VVKLALKPGYRVDDDAPELKVIFNELPYEMNPCMDDKFPELVIVGFEDAPSYT